MHTCRWPWVWPFKVIQHHRSYHHLTAHIWFPICAWYELHAESKWFQSYKAMKVCDFEFDLSRSSNIQGHTTIGKPIYNFLSVSHTNYVSKMNGFRVIKQSKSVTLSLTFQGHPTSKVISPFESPYMISYLCLIQTMCLKWMVSEL